MLDIWIDRIRRFLHPPVFTLQLDRGDARLLQGRAPHGFVEDCSEVAHGKPDLQGFIYGRGPGPHGDHIEFSPPIPPSIRQRLRNAYHFHTR